MPFRADYRFPVSEGVLGRFRECVPPKFLHATVKLLRRAESQARQRRRGINAAQRAQRETKRKVVESVNSIG